MKDELVVIVRIALYLLAGVVGRGGWLPPHIAEMFAADPAMVELATGAVMFIATFAAYWYSKARKALLNEKDTIKGRV
jgi:hypothetical protein